MPLLLDYERCLKSFVSWCDGFRLLANNLVSVPAWQEDSCVSMPADLTRSYEISMTRTRTLDVLSQRVKVRNILLVIHKTFQHHTILSLLFDWIQA